MREDEDRQMKEEKDRQTREEDKRMKEEEEKGQASQQQDEKQIELEPTQEGIKVEEVTPTEILEDYFNAGLSNEEKLSRYHDILTEVTQLKQLLEQKQRRIVQLERLCSPEQLNSLNSF